MRRVMKMNDFGKRLKEIRLRKGLSQKTVAKAIGLSRATLSKYENNKSIPTIPIILKLSEIFEVTLQQIFEDNKIETESRRIMSSFNNLTDEQREIISIINVKIKCFLRESEELK